MATLKERFIQMLEQDILLSEESAQVVESVIPAVSENDVQERLREVAKARREKAEERRQLLEWVKLAY